MFALSAVNSFFGDSLLLEYGTSAAPRYILIDGGPATTYDKHLTKVLKKVKDDGHDLELMVLSHVDTDHVTGLLDFIADIRNGNAALPAVKGLWHNSFSQTIDTNGALAPRMQAALAAAGVQAMSTSSIAINGISEGHQLRTQALAVPIPLNPGFANGLILADGVGAPWSSGNLEIIIVGPTKANLDALRTDWEEWLDAQENAINSGDPFVMANSDRSVPNLSSIQFLAKADGKTMLLTGDGRSDHLLQALRQAGLMSAQDTLHVDLLKLPHHGSDRNVTRTFFKKVTADTYVASADGKDDNPDLATLIWIVEAAEAAGREVKIVCTNKTLSTDKLQEDYDPADYGYKISFRKKTSDTVRIELAS